MNQNLSTRHRMIITLGLVAAAVTATAGCANGLQTTNPGADPSLSVPSASTAATPAASSGPSTASESPVSPASSTRVTSSASSASGTDATTTGRPTSTGASSSSTPRGSATRATRRTACAVSDLEIGVRAADGGGAAGSNYVLLTFRNSGPQSCTMYGYPGVSFVGHGDGTQLGVPAVRSRAATPKTVRLGAGKTTTALLQIVNAGVYDAKQCAPTTADGLRVYPPGSKDSAYVAFATQACQKDPGDSKQLSVHPIGTAG